MADTKTTPSKPRKVIDITEPGKSAPPSSGKPIIVTNRPVLRQDPMMVPTAPDLPATDPAPATSHTARPIQPPGRSIDSLLAAAPAQPPKKPAKADATPPVQPTAAKPAIALDAPAVPVSPATAVVAAKPDAAVPAASPAKATPATPAAPSADGASPAAASTPSASAPAAPAPATEPAASSSIPEEESATAGAGEAGPGDAQLAPNKALEDAKKKADEE
ncbi:MAG TPA: hypothetical protein VHC98_01665, partial [Candidatus Saccharimonadales bacterium]|nr:hypothetical protein [Candidatus Saccharimonadales bacterium]